ncbi:MAG: hypothetical protein QM657_17715 [Lacrimispora sp.]|uniref:hypothetical protein n=1 Tax=Lacrimispora sp. TaxID=2719234 RepID=UPI0039E41AD5
MNPNNKRMFDNINIPLPDMHVNKKSIGEVRGCQKDQKFSQERYGGIYKNSNQRKASPGHKPVMQVLPAPTSLSGTKPAVYLQGL